MPAIGYIQVHAYTSEARLPLEDVAIAITAEDGTSIALRLTDRSGLITPVEIPVPDKSASQSPEEGARPFTAVNLYARKRGFEQEEFEKVQVFADTITDQFIELIPLSELPGAWDQTAIFTTPPQNL